jgi:hypothetical protein
MTPTEFQKALDREFRGTMRLRWSHARRAWLLEAKAGRGVYDVAVATEGSRLEDESIQLRDGYRLFVELREVPKMPCQGCKVGLKLSPFETIQATCPKCKYVHVVACFPLGDSLLDHLRKLNPHGTYRENLKREADRFNELKTQTAHRDAGNVVDASTREIYNDLVGIPSFGYSGKTQAWVDAPASPLSPSYAS